MSSEIAKKIQNNLLKEQDITDYYYQLAVALDKKKIGQWTLDLDNMSGVLYLINRKYSDVSVVATPYWEGMKGIPLEIRNKDDNLIISKILPFKLSMNTMVDIKSYIGIMKRNINI